MIILTFTIWQVLRKYWDVKKKAILSSFRDYRPMSTKIVGITNIFQEHFMNIGGSDTNENTWSILKIVVIVPKIRCVLFSIKNNMQLIANIEVFHENASYDI